MITARGRKMRETLLGYAREGAGRALAGMRPGDVAKLRTLLSQVRENLESELFAMNPARERRA